MDHRDLLKRDRHFTDDNRAGVARNCRERTPKFGETIGAKRVKVEREREME